MQPQWLPKNLKFDAQSVSGPFPELIGRIISSRGLDPHNFDDIFSPKLSEIADPFLLKGMRAACDRLFAALENNEKICIYADFDLDGSSGLALLYLGLKGLGYQNLVHVQPKRLSEGYGFHSHIVDDLNNMGVSLIVTVDVGITANETCAHAQSLGIEVIITDHHLPGAVLPPALVVINPNQGECPSGLTYLSGAGVAFYLLRALKRTLHDKGRPTQFDLRTILDLFTIATITDMVPLRGDNRTLVKAGLVELAHTKKAGLKALLNALNMNQMELTAQDVALKFAPKLNALSRMELNILPVDLYLQESPDAAEVMVGQILQNNTQRVDLQAQADIEALEKLKDWNHRGFVMVASENFHKGIVGLVATKLSQLKNMPAFVGAVSADGIVTGSARVPNQSAYNLVMAMQSAAEYFTRFGGHAAAAGFEFEISKLPLIIERLEGYFKEFEEGGGVVPLFFDVEGDIASVNSNLMNWYNHLGPFGADFEVPVIRFNAAPVVEIRELKGGHYRLKFDSNKGFLSGILFGPTRWQKAALANSPAKLDLLAELQWNFFAGKKTVQLVIRDIRASGGAGI